MPMPCKKPGDNEMFMQHAVLEAKLTFTKLHARKVAVTEGELCWEENYIIIYCFQVQARV